MDEVMLTTVDNPFNPFTHWEEWLAYDMSNGYNSSGIVAAITNTSNEFSDKLESDEIAEAINHFVSIEPTNLFAAIKKTTKVPIGYPDASSS